MIFKCRIFSVIPRRPTGFVDSFPLSSLLTQSFMICKTRITSNVEVEVEAETRRFSTTSCWLFPSFPKRVITTEPARIPVTSYQLPVRDKTSPNHAPHANTRRARRRRNPNWYACAQAQTWIHKGRAIHGLPNGPGDRRRRDAGPRRADPPRNDGCAKTTSPAWLPTNDSRTKNREQPVRWLAQWQ